MIMNVDRRSILSPASDGTMLEILEGWKKRGKKRNEDSNSAGLITCYRFLINLDAIELPCFFTTVKSNHVQQQWITTRSMAPGYPTSHPRLLVSYSLEVVDVSTDFL
jgi:hypothetical protein